MKSDSKPISASTQAHDQSETPKAKLNVGSHIQLPQLPQKKGPAKNGQAKRTR